MNEAAVKLGVIPRRVRQLIRSGQIPAQKFGRAWAIDERTIEEYRPRPVGRPKACDHPPARLYAWYADDGTLVVCCNDCGKVIQGGARYPLEEDEEN